MNPINHSRRLAVASSDNFLIVRTDRLGDVVLTLPMARAIKTAKPDAHVAFLVREYTRPIVERAAEVDEVLVADGKIGLIRLIRQMREAIAGVVLIPSPRFSLALAAWLARVPIRVGTGYRWYSFLFNRKVYEHRKTAEHHEAEYNLRMLSHIGVSADMNCLPEIQLRPAEIIAVDEWRAETLGAASAGYVVLHTVCGGSTMEWPSEWFVELGRQLRERLACAIVLTGVEADRAKLSAMADAMNAQRVPFKGPPALFVGYPLTQLAALLAGAKAVVSVGTGPGHLAAALGTPSVGLFPLPHAISKERWGLRGKRAVKNVSPEPIAGCPDCKSCTCMERISVERVVMEVMNLAGPGARFG